MGKGSSLGEKGSSLGEKGSSLGEKGSSLGESSKEAAFALMWDDLGGPALEQQYRFHPVRRWRADFAHLESKTLIEIDGGVWVRGRHVRPDGFAGDCAKTNTATLDGWAVFRLTPDMITPDLLRSIVEFCRHRND